MAMPIHNDDNLSRVLLQKKLLDENALQQMQQHADTAQQTLFQYLLQHHLIDAGLFLNACADVFQLPVMQLENKNYMDLTLDALPNRIMKNDFILCVAKNNAALTIAICNPNDISLAKTLSFQMKLKVELVLVQYHSLCRIHNRHISKTQYQQKNDLKNTQLAQQMTHQLLSDAIHSSASDIHFEPYQKNARVRFRIDGILHEIICFPHHLTESITSCFKVLAHLDIAIKRMPQDGRLTFRSNLGFVKECRMSTCPTLHGEKIVIRILDAHTQIRPIEELGLEHENQKIILKSIAQPQGLILVTGPTGSGKTMTLYTLLHLLNQHHRNIATIEDPIEMQIYGINQTHINPKSGLTFSHTLRALLRQDPDVMMIGEIRDQETAEMAIRAAQTGHLVLSTLHTNSAAEAITRLHHMGIAPFHLSSALTLVIAQRLARKLCLHCAGKKNCTQCTDGFEGRIGIFELLPIQPTIKEMISNHQLHYSIAKKNIELGNMNLWQAALSAVKQGITTLEEIYRVVPYES